MLGSTPFPEEWINNNAEKFNLKDKLHEDFSNTKWGTILIKYFREEVLDCINSLKEIQKELKEDKQLEKYYLTIIDDINKLEKLIIEEYNWDDIYKAILNMKFEKWPIDRKVESELKDKSKDTRDDTKKRILNLSNKVFICSSKEANDDIYQMYSILKILEKVIKLFSSRYAENKKEKNIIDFGDIEHYALNILVKKDENGNYIPTDISKEYRQKYKEIAIDEYQDSNLVQEYILSTISNGKNIFMVGDVKQSIYKFRQARPELFLEKYDKYYLADNNKDVCKLDTKIQLFKNFRSRKNIVDVTNLVFSSIMSKKLGDIEYNQNEFLNLGAEYPECDKNEKTFKKAELDIINLENNDEETDTEFIIENNEIEARFVANRIKEILKDGYYIYDRKQGYRKATFKDIVILLRTTSDTATQYEKALKELEIPVFSDTSSNYFESTEIETIISLLKIIDNPNNDIPLVSVLRSEIGGFTDNDLIQIRLENKNSSFFEALCNTSKNSTDVNLKEKTEKFSNTLKQLQIKLEYLSLDEFIWYIYEITGYYDFVNSNTNGEIKTANLRLLFEKAKDYEKASFKGLYNFINYIEKMKRTSGDAVSAKLLGENDNVIRIMSIHKSKGLEFPIVFLCGTGKQFNMQDLNQSILLHQDLGFGPKYINYDRKIEYDTLAKEAIKIKQRNEILSEEMRLLYVALTRSKEKLIITGIDKNISESLEKKQKCLYINNNKKISEIILKKAKSYLDWIELVQTNNNSELIEMNIYNKNFEKTKNEEKNNGFEIQESKKTNVTVDKLLNWKYKYSNISNIEGKTSVTKISKNKKDELQEISSTPKFLESTIELSKSQIGTLMHLILQKLDFNKEYDENNIKELIRSLVTLSIITKEEAKYIDTNKILKFTQSEMFLKIKKAKKIYKEEPFYITINSDEIYNDKSEEKILVQGIIDLYFIDDNNNLVLLDYKTDYVEKDNERELIDKYKGQLSIYKRALEKALNKEVKETYIYSVYLNKTIKITF